jgi:hypothetical protein
MTRSRLVCLAIVTAVSVVGTSWAWQPPVHPTLLSGTDWASFSGRDKQLYLAGFISGAAAQAVLDSTMVAAGRFDSAAASSAAIDRLRGAKALPFPYAPAVYAAQIDDYYWWKNHVSTPLVDVLITLNRQMLAGQPRGGP